MNDIQQIIKWETERKALEWWNKLSAKQKWGICGPGYDSLGKEAIVEFYNKRT